MTTTPVTATPAAARGLLVGATLLLFGVWSHTFLAFEVLLAPRSGPAPMGWLDLVVARFAPVWLVCAAWCFGFHARESLAILRRHLGRLLLCGLLAVPVYNGFLYYAMERRVSGPVASLLTTLSPLWLVLLGALALRERVGPRQVAGLCVGFAGVLLVALGKGGAGGQAGTVLLLAVAPLAWSVHSALTKPVMREVSPLLWTYLVLVVGSTPLLFLLPAHGGPQLAALDAKGWSLVLFLSLAATVFGFAVWSWLLRHLPASTTGLTVFLNPPLTTTSKFLLSLLLPASFAFDISPLEWGGGALALAGVALATLRRSPRPEPAPAPPVGE